MRPASEALEACEATRELSRASLELPPVDELIADVLKDNIDASRRC